jgi:hypothetical protein
VAIAFVNSAVGNNDASATSLAAASANHTTGNLVVVGVVWSNNVNANVPTDTAGNTYVSTGVRVNNGTSDHIEIFYAKNITGNAANVVTANFAAAATFRRIVVLQYSGCHTTAPFDVGGTNTAASGTTVTATATAAMAQAAEVQCSFAAGANTEVWSCTSHTMRTTSLGTDSGAGDRIHAAIITPAAAFSGTTSAALWACTATFKAAGGAITPAMGQLSETDTAQPITRRKIKTLGQLTETDTAQPITHVHQRTLGQLTETDTAQPVGRLKRKTLGEAQETDVVFTIIRSGTTKTVVLGLLSDTESLQPVTARKIKVIGSIAEVDVLFTITRLHSRTTGLLTEVDTAQSIVAVKGTKRVTLGLLAESDTVFTIGVFKVLSVVDASSRPRYYLTRTSYSNRVGRRAR